MAWQEVATLQPGDRYYAGDTTVQVRYIEPCGDWGLRVVTDQGDRTLYLEHEVLVVEVAS